MLSWGIIPISLLALSILLSSFNVIRVKSVTFPSADSLIITADEYTVSEELPYVILFHEQGASRGEFMQDGL